MTDPGLSGVFTALVTPFVRDGSAVDIAAYEALVEAQLAGGVSGLVPCGTTGESPTLTDSEQRELIQRTARLAKGRARVYAGTGTNDTKKSVEASRAAIEAGADGVMIVTPYYSKPSQEGLIQHVSQIAKAVDAPVIVYNIPGRSVVELSIDSLLRILDTNPNVVGLKDASGNALYCQEIVRRVGERIAVLSGDDILTLPLMSVGARGVISVTSNFYPKQVSDVVRAADAGRWRDARSEHFRLLPVHRAFFLEPSPAPIKAALAAHGRMQPTVRLPLVEASEQCRAEVAQALKTYEAA
ncbi:MAG TPA: 4-hydroxy-tetrahydrodipicolinate synthase [Polyangiaceae bacterium]|nr:4-hydroxy-tetrahydrodipicolinate synthase [Polyangiaceae bacterium]